MLAAVATTRVASEAQVPTREMMVTGSIAAVVVVVAGSITAVRKCFMAEEIFPTW